LIITFKCFILKVLIIKTLTKNRGKIVMITGSTGMVRSIGTTGEAEEYPFESSEEDTKIGVGSEVSFEIENSNERPVAINIQPLNSDAG
jgi:hypothetical protein